ncbi:ECF transporter S component, partial [Clostridium sp.]|uniref:ECF transporter S component n=1 Tax=Clostridium sp. TaxID=1506 RepID=UPI00261C96F4
ALILPASFVYSRNKSKKSAILGMVLGAVCMEVVGIVSNVYFLLPAYGMQMSPAESIKYIALGLLPFNGIKALIVSVLTYIVYKKVSVSIFKAEPNFGSPENKRKTI